MIGVVVVTHGQFGQELLRTAEEIVGRQNGAIALTMTPDTSTELLGKAVEEAVTRLQSPEGILFLVDMLGGTPCNTVTLKMKDRAAEIITGVNLYMLLSAFTHRGQMDLRALALKVCEDGKRAITMPKDLLVKRTVS